MASTSRCIVCLIENDPIRVIVAEVPLGAPIATLKELIQGKRKRSFLREVDPDELQLWKLKNPVPVEPDETRPKRVGYKDLPNSANRLGPVSLISELFPEPIPLKYLYVVATLPRRPVKSSEPSIISPMLALRIDYAQRRPMMSPSALGQPATFLAQQTRHDEPAFYFDRPPTAAGVIPVSLLHRIFAQFMDDCKDHVPVQEDTKLALEITSPMTRFYTSETLRMAEFRTVMTDNNLQMQVNGIEGTPFTTEGDMRTNGFCYCLATGRNEIGSTGAEPVFQAGGYCNELMVNASKEYPHARLPMLLLYLMGAHLGFVGAVWTARPNMQILVRPLVLSPHYTDNDARTVNPQHLGALRKAISSLRAYYDSRSFPSALDVKDQPQFPYQRQYASLNDGVLRTFSYKSQIPTKLVFFGEADDGGKICIKFVHTYSKDAHLKCAELGFAPSLRGFETLPGGWRMVVMDQIDTSFHMFGISDSTDTLYERLKQGITHLHQAGFVHGDIRDANLLVREADECPMLVDFDWAGSIGTARYPLYLNRANIQRPVDVRDGSLILADHDIGMLDLMFGGK